MTDYGVSLMPAWVPQGTGFAVENNALPSSNTSAASLLGALAQGFTNTTFPGSAPVSPEAPAMINLNNGPRQWTSMATLATAEQKPVQSSTKTTPVTTQKVEPTAATKITSRMEKPSKIPQWAWEATSAIDESVARIAIAHLLSKECDPTDIHKVVDHPNDPGRITKYGIAQRYHPTKNVANLTIEQAVQIYYNEYWIPNRNLLSSLPSDGMRVATLDAFAHHGVEGTKKLLKKIATQLTPNALGKARIAELRTKDHAGSFINGWETRIEDVTAFAESTV
ncbi:MAG: glycosyl hydrolase 108 family protein [Vampirovibrionales bacterium]|nr:glycosyl hydrolase 108 family protein [Vampirovibrionales bacterium]